METDYRGHWRVQGDLYSEVAQQLISVAIGCMSVNIPPGNDFEPVLN